MNSFWNGGVSIFEDIPPFPNGKEPRKCKIAKKNIAPFWNGTLEIASFLNGIPFWNGAISIFEDNQIAPFCFCSTHAQNVIGPLSPLRDTSQGVENNEQY